MLRRSACLGLAVAAALAGASVARAEQKSELALIQQPIYADDAAPAPEKPLMAELDKTPASGPLKSAGININGFVEGSWTYNFMRPSNQINNGRVFDFEDQDKTLNQADIQISRAVDASQGKFDVGFMVEMMYGADARLIHSNGLNFYGPNYAGNSAAEHPNTAHDPDASATGDFDNNNEFDLTQCYATIAVPVGSGLTLTAGKFVTLLGYETINPTTNALYSHSYMFGFAIPFTQTGVMGKYNITKDVAFTLGMSRGWEQTNVDNNGAVDGFGQIAWTVNDKLNIIANAICGPEQANDTSHYRTVIDLCATYKLGDNTTIGVNTDYGYGSREGNDVGGDGKPGTADWWGAAIYVGQKIDSHFTFNVRGEYFNDEDGARGLDAGVTELTCGVTVTPFPGNAWLSGLMFRPEVRWDWANENIFNDNESHDQVTVGGDLIYAF